MSLYDSASDNSNIKAIVAVGGRPLWLTTALVLTVIYAIASLTQIVIEYQHFQISIAVHSLLIILSAIYVFKPITAIGLAAAAVWVASLLSACSYIFEMEIAAAEYFLIAPNLGIENIGVLAQPVLAIAIFLFSSLKYRPVPKT